MNIPFMLKFPWGDPTYFREKLLLMAVTEGYIKDSEFYEGINLCDQPSFVIAPKKHTFRAESERFKPGMKVQPFVWSGQPYRSKQSYFMPLIPIISKQKIEILFFKLVKEPDDYLCYILIDGKLFNPERYDVLAINDGFHGFGEMVKYFSNQYRYNKDFKGEIRHFTKLRY